MKVAIMGAGISGLACAVILEKNGIIADVFERQPNLTSRFQMAEGMFSIFDHPVYDHVKFFSEEYGIYLNPASHISKIAIYSKNERAELNGHLGFVFPRGNHPDAMELKLADQLNKTPIYFSSERSYEDLLREYTHVVVATGDPDYTIKLQSFQTDFTSTLKGGVVRGNFERTAAHAWFDYDVTPYGMGYLLPFSDQEATLSIAMAEYDRFHEKSPEHWWDAFYQKACDSLGQKLEVIEPYHVKDYIVGKSLYPRIGNTFFIGNCFGAIMPFLGFGQFTSLLTGIYAALDISGKGDYEELTKPIYQSYDNSLALRRGIEKLSNDQLDLIVKSADLPITEKIINTRSVDPLKWLSRLIRPLT